jgi:hypothetical protein
MRFHRTGHLTTLKPRRSDLSQNDAVVTGSFVIAATGAFYLLEGQREPYARIFLKVGVIAGLIASIFIILPTDDLRGKFVAGGSTCRLQRGAGIRTRHWALRVRTIAAVIAFVNRRRLRRTRSA